MNALSDQARVQVEQKIALGWSDSGIARLLKVSAKSVCRVRLQLDSIADVDLFDLFEHRATLLKTSTCRRGHKITPENTYRKGNGRRECLKCKTDRQRARYEAAGLAA